jgi:hypothetical protein
MTGLTSTIFHLASPRKQAALPVLGNRIAQQRDKRIKGRCPKHGDPSGTGPQEDRMRFVRNRWLTMSPTEAEKATRGMSMRRYAQLILNSPLAMVASTPNKKASRAPSHFLMDGRIHPSSDPIKKPLAMGKSSSMAAPPSNPALYKNDETPSISSITHELLSMDLVTWNFDR